MTRFLAIVAVAVAAVACTPEQQEQFRALPPDAQRAVLDALAEPVDCYTAVDRFWPAEHRAWFRGVVWRESRNDPTAANPSSTARGCAQLLMSLHSWRFTAVGCSPSAWADASCNVRAALHLFREAGRSPWE